jgi:hypothetical protein
MGFAELAFCAAPIVIASPRSKSQGGVIPHLAKASEKGQETIWTAVLAGLRSSAATRAKALILERVVITGLKTCSPD